MAKKIKKVKRLNSARFSRRYLAVFAVIFAVIGGYFIYESFAAVTLPYAEAQLRTGYVTLTVPASTQNIDCPAGKDCLIDLQWTKRTVGSLLIWGQGDSRIKVINGYWEMNVPVQSGDSGYWRSGPRVRSRDNIGPAHISMTNMIVVGTTQHDPIAIAGGTNTVVTIQQCRLEAPRQSGSNSKELTPDNHPDGIQIQGLLKRLEVGLCTIFASDNPLHGGKGFMLNKEPPSNPPFSVSLNKVNLRAQGTGTGALIFDWLTDITISMTDVWALTENSGNCGWSNNSCMLFPNSGSANGNGLRLPWTSTGTAPNRIATFDPAANITGQIREGLPGGVDFMPRNAFPPFGGTTPPPTAPTVSLSANPTSITSGSSSTLSWSSTNATSCTASGAWSGAKTTSGTQSVSPTATSIYNLSCTGTGGTANASATVTVTAAPPPSAVNIPARSVTHTVDGNLTESDWSLNNTVSKTVLGSTTATASWGATWDNNYLYIGVRVTDSALHNDSTNCWEDDSVELYIDGAANGGTTYDSNDRQLTRPYNDSALCNLPASNTPGTLHAWAVSSGGYSVEYAVPWSAIATTPTTNKTIGIDIGLNDDSNGGVRDGQKMWAGTASNASNPSAFGRGTLTGTPPSGGVPPHIAAADLNNDSTVNILDLSILLRHHGTTDPAADINGDGQVNITDLSILLSKYQ